MTEEEWDAKRRKAEARDLVTSWVLALWALGTGIYLTSGGAKHLLSPAYHYLLPLFDDDYHLVGIALLIAAVVNIIGVAANRTLTLAIGAILCATWLGVVGLAMMLAAFKVTDGGNLNWTTAIGLSACFAIRAYNKINPPRMPPVMGFFTLALMPLIL